MQGESYQDNPYEVLGVDRNATADQIRRAYHRAVRAWHPDLRPEAGEEGLRRLQRARWAYDTLRDPRGRARYDACEKRRYEGPGITAGLVEGFRGFVGNLKKHLDQLPRRGRDLRVLLEVELEDLVRGGRYEIEFEREGAEGGASVRQAVEVCLPPATPPGAVLRLSGMGRPGTGGEPPGDLLVRVEPRKHPLFVVDGFDLELELPLPLPLLLEGRFGVPTLEGEIQVAAGRDFRERLEVVLEGRGLFMPGGGRGRLVVRVIPELPEGLTGEKLAALSALLGSAEPEAYPRYRRFRQLARARQARAAGGRVTPRRR